ncbi:hypothetical protein GCM10011506_35120 [Marivirga lumbricoides]|uniref:Cytidyltransferase-like domain-containing protein n=1 Tax=Marivirga lumbricoides TaxID=1046115 RepID=A0ABQ1MTZ2_9BACT|nr:hypothetical protein GCM10011506_35120 [Marivirga lumbricoides]
MKNRCLYLIEANEVELTFIKKLCKIAQSYEQAIFVLRNADLLNKKNTKTGDLISALHSILKSESKTPFFVIPYASKGNAWLSYWLRLKLLTPTFEKIFTTQAEDEEPSKKFINCDFELLEFEPKKRNPIVKTIDRALKRGLFITRAQPLHNGHAAFIEEMANENDEFIILLAAAEQCHQSKNPLSATERLEMVHSYLNSYYTHRFYLVALPQNSFTLENMYELSYLLPDFQSVYATNPVIISMCNSMNIPVKTLKQNVNISATEIRNRILKNEPCGAMLPPLILSYLEKISFQERLRLINHQYQR